RRRGQRMQPPQHVVAFPRRGGAIRHEEIADRPCRSPAKIELPEFVSASGRLVRDLRSIVANMSTPVAALFRNRRRGCAGFLPPLKGERGAGTASACLALLSLTPGSIVSCRNDARVPEADTVSR